MISRTVKHYLAPLERVLDENESVRDAAYLYRGANPTPKPSCESSDSRPKPASGPAKTASEPQMPGRGLNQENSGNIWRFRDITGRNHPVLSLHHRPSLLPSERPPRSPNKGTRAC